MTQVETLTRRNVGLHRSLPSMIEAISRFVDEAVKALMDDARFEQNGRVVQFRKKLGQESL